MSLYFPSTAKALQGRVSSGLRILPLNSLILPKRKLFLKLSVQHNSLRYLKNPQVWTSDVKEFWQELKCLMSDNVRVNGGCSVFCWRSLTAYRISLAAISGAQWHPSKLQHFSRCISRIYLREGTHDACNSHKRIPIMKVQYFTLTFLNLKKEKCKDCVWNVDIFPLPLKIKQTKKKILGNPSGNLVAPSQLLH